MATNNIELSRNQVAYINEANHRWNISIGAVRSGKSHLAIRYRIPAKLLENKGRKGINLILGATRENIERNVLSPMRDIYGEALVGEIKTNNNVARIFGEDVHCMGAEKVSTVKKLRGSEVKYCYCDEIADINEDVFTLLKSRLSLEYSSFDGAANPASPSHWLKKFLDTPGLDMYVQHSTIYDNPFLPVSYVHELEKEYAGTIFYDRYILGKWTLAEGLIYPKYKQAVEEPPEDMRASRYVISLDYGTQNAFAAILWARDRNSGTWYAIDEYYYSGRKTGEQKTDEEYLQDLKRGLAASIPGGEETLLIVDPSAASFITLVRKSARGVFNVRKAKNDVQAGIQHTASSMNTGAIKISTKCKNLLEELAGYAWDTSTGEDKPVKVDDHACDALRYFVETIKPYNKQEEYESVFYRR